MKVIITDPKGMIVIDRDKSGQVTRFYACGSVVDKEEDLTTKQAWINAGIAVQDNSKPEKNV